MLVDIQKVVLFDQIPEEEKYEGKNGNYWHCDTKEQTHVHDRESERPIVAQLVKPVIFVRFLLEPIEERKHVFPEKVRYVEQLDAVGNEGHLHDVCDEKGCHVAHI